MMHRRIVTLFMFAYFPCMALYMGKYNCNSCYNNIMSRADRRQYVCWNDEDPSDVNNHEEWKSDTNDNVNIGDEVNTKLEDFDELDEEQTRVLLGKYNKLWVAYYDEFYSKKAFMRRNKKRQRIWKRWDKTITEYKQKLNKFKKNRWV